MTTPDDSPSASDTHWQQWLHWADQHQFPAPTEPTFAAARQRVLAASEFVAQSLAQQPAQFAALLASGALYRAATADELTAQLSAQLNAVTTAAQLSTVLRQFRRAQMMRIIWRELSDWAELNETFAALTALADVCIQQTVAQLYAWQINSLGTPTDAAGQPQSLVVLGLGKLGGGELNLSSDIDLIFAFPRHGTVSGGAHSLTNEQFFIRLCQQCVQLLNTPTADGFVFRVDTRLRPFGDSGPLAMSFEAMEDYYQAQAREWERYAMIKARVIVGTPAAAQELSTMLRSFVYRRYLDFAAIAALRQLKMLIARELHRKGAADNIKLGPGGIREIEFIAQAHQLIRGGRDPDLQVRSLLTVLALLAAKGILPPPTVNELTAAYCFLRRLENRLQAWRDQQTHVLPTAAADQLRLAQSMGYTDWAQCHAVLQHHRANVQRHFDTSIAERGLPAAEQYAPSSLSELWPLDADADRGAALLRVIGFAVNAAPQLYQRLIQFEQAVARKGLSRRGAERLEQLMPRVLRYLAATPTPAHEQTLQRVLRVLEAIVGRTAYLALLLERPEALEQLLRLCVMSPWFSERTARQPLLLDELLDPQRLCAPLRRSELTQELTALLAGIAPNDLEQHMERLRQFAHGQQLRVAAADVTGVIPLMVVSDYLTEIAEVTVAHSLVLAWRDLHERFAVPDLIDNAAAASGFLIVGYGKLGGIELGYRSDLDLVFLYDDELLPAPAQFYLRLSQRLIHILTTPTYSGILYDIDTRLRPDGNKGFIARTLASFAEYQFNEAWTWEHQALVRARPIAGDARLIAQFQQQRQSILAQPRAADSLRAEVVAMRMKMRTALDRSTAEQFDLKQGAGGIADIEFMVQYAVLRWAADYSELTQWTDNIRLLATLEQLALLPAPAAAELTAAYKTLRSAYHQRALQDAPGVINDNELITVRATVRQWWERVMGA